MGPFGLRGVLSLVLLGSVCLTVGARQDLLNEVKQRREIAVQQLESDLRDFVNDAQKLQGLWTQPNASLTRKISLRR